MRLSSPQRVFLLFFGIVVNLPILAYLWIRLAPDVIHKVREFGWSDGPHTFISAKGIILFAAYCLAVGFFLRWISRKGDSTTTGVCSFVAFFMLLIFALGFVTRLLGVL